MEKERRESSMTQGYKEERKALMKAYPFAVSKFFDGKWRYSHRTDDPEKYIADYRRTYGSEPRNIRITDSRTKKVVYQN